MLISRQGFMFQGQFKLPPQPQGPSSLQWGHLGTCKSRASTSSMLLQCCSISHSRASSSDRMHSRASSISHSMHSRANSRICVKTGPLRSSKRRKEVGHNRLTLT